MVDDVIYIVKNIQSDTLGFCIVFFLHEEAAPAREVFRSCVVHDYRIGVHGR